MGEIVSPTMRDVYKVSATGKPLVLPGVGGITYNLRVGDPAYGWEADHAEPGVSTENKENDARTGQAANTAFNVLSCVGNQAIVATGDAKGDRGIVTGKHGGVEHVLIDFSPDVLEKLLIGDRILIKAYGVGLKLLDYPDIKLFNTDPSLLEALNPQPSGEKLLVPVTHIVPAAIMGSGLGSNQVNSGDYDIQLFDQTIVEQYGLQNLRLGDIVGNHRCRSFVWQNLPTRRHLHRRRGPYKLLRSRTRTRSNNLDDIGRGQNCSPDKSESERRFSLKVKSRYIR